MQASPASAPGFCDAAIAQSAQITETLRNNALRSRFSGISVFTTTADASFAAVDERSPSCLSRLGRPGASSYLGRVP